VNIESDSIGSIAVYEIPIGLSYSDFAIGVLIVEGRSDGFLKVPASAEVDI